jgi:hypothetical protein
MGIKKINRDQSDKADNLPLIKEKETPMVHHKDAKITPENQDNKGNDSSFVKNINKEVLSGKKEEIVKIVRASPQKEQTDKPPDAIKPQNGKEQAITDAPHSKQMKKETDLVIKSGATDLRRSEIALTHIVVNRMGQDMLTGNMYAFTNKNLTRIKVIQKKPDGISMFKKSSENPIKKDWPEYNPSTESGYTVKLSGKEKKQFLKDIGCPETL